VCTPTLTHYRVGKRGEMLSGVSGIIVHDFFRGGFHNYLWLHRDES
jgi:hypothetical protein